MAYNNIISRTDAQALVPEDVAYDMLESMHEQSAALRFFRQRRMPTNQTRLPVKSALPTAYFVNGDTGLKQTTEVNWGNAYLNVEEIACIVPIPEAVVDDVNFDAWGEIKPDIEESIGQTLDAAVFFGVNKPASWPTDIATAAAAASNTYTRGTNNAAAGGIAEDVNQTMAKVESDGFAPTGFVTDLVYKARLRSARDTTGQKILDVATNEIEGLPLQYAMGGLWPAASGKAELFTGDFRQGIIGVRQDITYKVLDQAVIQDNAGTIIYNLAQQDMVALRVVARFAFAVPNPINRRNTNTSTRYPFAALLAP